MSDNNPFGNLSTPNQANYEWILKNVNRFHEYYMRISQIFTELGESQEPMNDEDETVVTLNSNEISIY